jgi:hypothetical protein
MSGGSSGPSSTTSITKTDPPAYLQPYLTDIATKAQGAYNQVPQGGFTGDLVATPNANQTGAVNQTLAKAGSLDAGGFGADTSGIASTLANKVNTGAYTAPASNTFTSTNLATPSLIDSYLQPVQARLQNEILPSLTSQAVSQGAYGGSRYATEAAVQVNNEFTTTAANIASQLGYGEGVRHDANALDVFKTNQGLYPELFKQENAAAGLQPSIASAGVTNSLLPQQLTASAGNQQQLWAQDLLDQAYQQYVLSTQTPFAGLGEYANTVNGGAMGGVSSTSGTGVRPSGGGVGGFISGGLGGAASGAAIGSVIPGVGTVAGAILGGLLGGGSSFF